jgi:hypothetical protein
MFLSVALNFRRPIYPPFIHLPRFFRHSAVIRSLGNDLSRVIAASVCDHRLGYQHARWTHTIAAGQFLHHVLGNNFQQTLFAFA